MAGAFVENINVPLTPLSAQPTQIFYDATSGTSPGGPESNIFFVLTDPSVAYVAFDNNEQNSGIASHPPVIDELNGPSRPIAFIEVTTTPLPAALPLFATGLSALGLLGWRRKRNSAVQAI
jgi:hypothetical protein